MPQRKPDVVQGEHTSVLSSIVLDRRSSRHNNLDAFEWSCACECLKSDAVDHFHRNEPAAHERSIYSLLHIVQPLTSDLLASNKRDRRTFEQLMSDHTQSVGRLLPHVEPAVHPSCDRSDKSLVDLMRGNVTHRNLVNRRQETSHGSLPLAFRPLLFHGFVISRDKRPDGRLRQALGYSSPAQRPLPPSLQG